jgi:hypothetical protein
MTLLRGLDVWQVRVRHKEPQLVVSLPVPVGETRVPLPIFRLLPQLVECVTAHGRGSASRTAEGADA